MKLLVALLVSLNVYAAPVELVINEHTLSCSNGSLTVTAVGVSALVSEFKVANLEHPCFYRIYLVDKATANGGELTAEVQVTRTTVREPIYKCPPKPCPFCDPGDCQVVGHRDLIEESVYIDILGLRFSAKNKIKENL